MTTGCGNPNCEVHGSSESAVGDRKSRQRIVTNPEMMTVIRMIAGNVHNNMIHSMGLNMGVVEKSHILSILDGNFDADPVVEGIMDGFIVLLREHGPTDEFLTACAAVPEAEGLQAKRDALVEENRRNNPPQGFQFNTTSFASLEELFGHLFGQPTSDRKPH